MQTTHKVLRNYWATPVIGVIIGALYLVGFSIGGQPLIGVGCRLAARPGLIVPG
jgi:hypothetical protein